MGRASATRFRCSQGVREGVDSVEVQAHSSVIFIRCICNFASHSVDLLHNYEGGVITPFRKYQATKIKYTGSTKQIAIKSHDVN